MFRAYYACFHCRDVFRSHDVYKDDKHCQSCGRKMLKLPTTVAIPKKGNRSGWIKLQKGLYDLNDYWKKKLDEHAEEPASK